MAATHPAKTDGLRLVGSPRRLTLTSALLAAADEGELVLPETLAAFAESRTVAVPVRRRRDGSVKLKLRLPPTTPPGTYTAELHAAGEVHPVSIEVAPAPRLRIDPPSTDFVAEANGTAEARVTLTNDGNVAIEVPERVAIGLYDDEGLETAFADTYRLDTDDPMKLLGNWIRKLREGYGGLLSMQVVTGAGRSEPGDVRALVLRLAFRNGVKAGHSYHGTWELGPVIHRINVTVRR
jgi:hypothetical protein